MISICIPVYNFNINQLIYELSKQIRISESQFEIIVIDDSSSIFKIENKNICQNHRYIELSENIGRAKIRNLFLKYAKYEYLLFLDCDSLVTEDLFLSNYLDIIKQNPKVVCGGRIYDSQIPPRSKRLRWKYGILKESKSCDERKKHPNKSFMTNNFLIQKTVLENNKFDERIQNYGHEDTLFGYTLKTKNIEITHIDNPITNGDLEFNDIFLRKTKDGVINLLHIQNFTENKTDLINEISLLQFYSKVKKIENILLGLFIISKPLIKQLLISGYSNLIVFDLYKLGILIEYKRKLTYSHNL